ncbi:DUF2975 domain-containing protein [Dyella subtropica]|uniref:DUF2975 domain-containing protein n=1 Tax=Dyella subtropica TaxID=2992127 RepID=UPI0022524A73|nr:DUF2975 domain-containing protein [Dyella subtropica]
MVGKSTVADIRRRSARLRQFVTCLLAALWVLLMLERFGAVAIQLSTHGFDGEPLRRLADQLVAACPEVFYLLSLWWIRQALAAFARGELYTSTITKMLGRVGAMLAAGAFISVFLVPAATYMLGFGPGYWVAFDVSGLVLGAVGLSLHIIGRVLQRASELQAEIDEIF